MTKDEKKDAAVVDVFRQFVESVLRRVSIEQAEVERN